MSEFWIISNFLRQNSFENAELHELCKAVAVKYLENEKNDLRANSAREENVILQIDVGNLKQLYQSVTEVIEVQSASEALLSQYYDEQIKMASDVDQQEKIYGYDEIKTELETRDSICMYEELYSRRIEMAKKMEERQIVKKYRHKEQDLLKSENDCHNLEQNLKAIKAEADEVQATIQETILRLVKGSKELEITPTPTPSERTEKRQILSSLSGKTPDRNLFTKKPGLSSRLSIIFKPSKVPSAIVAPRIKTLNPTKGLDRLLQEAEILRKSMQSTPDDSPSIVKPSIISKESKKEKSLKKVTFDLVTPEEIPMIIESSPDEPKDSLKMIAPALGDTEQKASGINSKCVILENIVIKPPGAPLPLKIRTDVQPLLITVPEVSSKRKIDQDHAPVCTSPQKKKRIDSDTKAVDASRGLGNPKSFMDVFTDFSKDSTLEISSISTTKEDDTPCTSSVDKKPVPEDVVVEDRKQEISFGEFFASLTKATSENNNTDFPLGENTFDFFDTNDDTGDGGNCEEDDFPFNF